MRDIFVDASPIVIEAIHKIPCYGYDFYEIFLEEKVDYDDIINFLIEGRGSWV